MTASVRENILAHLVSLTTAALPGTPVYRSRGAALSPAQLPAVVVTPMQDDPGAEKGSVQWINWKLQVAVDVILGDGSDSAADPLMTAIYKALMADRELSPVAGVIEILPGGSKFEIPYTAGELAFARQLFIVSYSTRDIDPTVAR